MKNIIKSLLVASFCLAFAAVQAQSKVNKPEGTNEKGEQIEKKASTQTIAKEGAEEHKAEAKEKAEHHSDGADAKRMPPPPPPKPRPKRDPKPPVDEKPAKMTPPKQMDKKGSGTKLPPQ